MKRRGIRMPRATVRYMRALAAIEETGRRRMRPAMARQFDAIANAVGQAFEAIVAPEIAEAAANSEIAETKAVARSPENGDEFKQFEQDQIPDWIRRVMNSSAVEVSTQRAFERAFEQQYAAVGQATFDAANARLGVAINFAEDPGGVRVINAGGRRAGLADVSKDTRAAIFRALSAGREAGEGPPALARRIRSEVKVGRFTGIAQAQGVEAAKRHRAELIARTETKNAQNVSTIEHYRSAGVQQVRIVDAQLGATDAECEDLNGTIVEMSEAEQFIASEHPSGTRSFDPIVPS